MTERYGYINISVKRDAQKDLTKWQLLVQHRLGRRVNASDALRMAIATATGFVDDNSWAGADAITDPTKGRET
jgi:hypothetical protein